MVLLLFKIKKYFLNEWHVIMEANLIKNTWSLQTLLSICAHVGYDDGR
jgi:hypothetical protein